MNRLTMAEFPSSDAHSSAVFFRAAFGWEHLAYGPHYTDVQLDNEQTLGFQEDTAEAPPGPLTIIEVDDLDASPSHRSISPVVADSTSASRAVTSLRPGRAQVRDPTSSCSKVGL